MQGDKTIVVALEWVQAHCVVPDGLRKGRPFELYDYQLQYLANFYLVRSDTEWDPENPVFAPAFRYRRGLLVGPQKLGKNPMIAAQVCLEAVGPSLFAGWAGKGDGYSCRDHGCRCGFEYPYDPGEPMGMLRATPLIQITAYSQEATDNTYNALRPMIETGPLHDVIPKTGEEFIRLPGNGRIDAVTSSAPSRLGNPVTFAPEDEVGIYTKRNGMAKLVDTQWRGLAGMSGRASLTSNAWDPAEDSVAQQQFESKALDVYRQFTQAPKNLSYANKRERHKIHQVVYPADTLRQNGGHVDLDAIEAESADLLTRDEAQARRFFGNILTTGAGRAFDIDVWRKLAVKTPKVVPDGALITIGGDGSRIWDATSLIATEVTTGYQWPLGIWERPQGIERWEVPIAEVDLTLSAAIARFDVWRVYFDPPYWESMIAAWAGKYGDERIKEWWTNRPKAYGYALQSWHEAQRTGEVTHCALTDPYCSLFSSHVGNAFRQETGYIDGSEKVWIVTKDRPQSPDKIDSVPAAALSWEARNDAIASGVLDLRPSAYEDRGLITL